MHWLALALLILIGAFVLYLRQYAPKGRAPEWPALRRIHLEKEPACVVCGTKEDLEVHHVCPVSYYPELELNPNNLMTLCRTHHYQVGHLEKWSAWNMHARADAAFWAARLKERLEKRL